MRRNRLLFVQALAFFGQAARKGLPEASYNLGVMNLNGLGMWRNPSKAREFFTAAAAAQHVGATYQLAKMMHHGVSWHPRANSTWTFCCSASLRCSRCQNLRVRRYDSACKPFFNVSYT